MLEYKDKFQTLQGVKLEPNSHETHLFERGQKYIQKLSKIPGIEMISIVNSLSMYATHSESDIDIFIITKPGMIWFVRFFSTLILWKHGVWRKGEDIAGNLCLSFFITTEAMDLSRVAIEHDIYLYYWVYYMKPIIVKNDTYEKFLNANTWVEIDEKQKIENQKYTISNSSEFVSSFYKFCLSFKRYAGRKIMNSGGFGLKKVYKHINQVIRFFLLPQTLKSHTKLGNPEGIIISDSMLKFHDRDKRKEIRDRILENNFDK